MAADRPVDLAARVVAWHNRNPLARRITPAQVASIGLVSFPFRAPPGSAPGVAGEPAADDLPAGGSLRERAQARARAAAQPDAAAQPEVDPSPAPAKRVGRKPAAAKRRGWRRAFSEDLLSPTSPAGVARWVLRHGSEVRPGPEDAPVRELDADFNGPRGAAAARLWAFTAAVDLGAVRLRLLASPLAPHAVLGQRLLDRRRLGALTLGLVLALGGAGLWWRGQGLVPMLALVPAPSTAASSASAAARTSVAAVATAGRASAPSYASSSAATAVESSAAPAGNADASAAALADGPRPASAAVAPAVAARRAPASAAATVPPAPVLDRKLDGPVRLVAPLDEATRLAAREASDAARQERAQRLATRIPQADAAAAAARGAAAAASAVAAAPAAAPATRLVWAVTTRNLRTRFESEQMLAALRDAAQRAGPTDGLRLEVLPAGDDWRAVGWPFSTQAEAEKLRAALAARGLQAQVVPF